MKGRTNPWASDCSVGAPEPGCWLDIKGRTVHSSIQNGAEAQKLVYPELIIQRVDKIQYHNISVESFAQLIYRLVG